MKTHRYFPNRIQAFRTANEGAVLPLIGFTLVVLIAATGIAIDTGRGQLVHAKLSNSLDAAGLAAGATISTVDVQSVAKKYLKANFPVGYMGATVTNVTATANDDGSIINLSATASVPTTFMRVMGHQTMVVSATSEITRASKGLELVMVLDNTGSMNYSAGGGTTRISALKSSATKLVNILYGNKSTVENLWIGLVPFSQAVNIGTSHSGWTTTTSYSWGPTSWAGCVEARFQYGRDVTDDPPSIEKFEKYYSFCAPYYYSWSNSWYGTNYSKTNCNSGYYKQYRTPLTTSGVGPNQYCPEPVTMMTASKSVILNAINALDAVGSTHTNLGMVWGWRMISPRWQGEWGGEMDSNGLPLAYNTPLMSKAVILLSDGDNQHVDYNYSAYEWLSAGRLGTTNTNIAQSKLDNKTTQVCTAMKSNNIIVYTIALGDTISSAGKNLMKNCASQPDYYFESPNADTLEAAFQTIGDSLANLRVSQ